MDTDEKNQICKRNILSKKRDKKIKAILKKYAVPAKYICRYCGKEATKPHGGKCPYSHQPNIFHEFIKM